MKIEEINSRYSGLAESECCLSCGGALNFSKANAGEVCVDLGSGRGTDVLRLADLVGEKGFVYGIDISDGMIEKARRNVEKLGVTNVRFIRCELEKLELGDEAVDLVISNCTLNHAYNKQEVWNEIHRILKKGGRFVVSDVYAINPIPDEYRNDPVAVAECWAGSVTRQEYLLQMETAGFSEVTILEESASYLKGKAEVASFTIAGIKTGCQCGI